MEEIGFMKKLINNPENAVNEMLEGFVKAYPQYVKRLEGLNVIVRSNSKTGKVALVSGGGSGHEPAHAGYVGEGMLDAAVAGEVFTSPTPDQVYEAIKAVDNGKGVLLIIKNYTGDIMNFEMASDMAKDEGIEVEQVVVNDDVAVEDSTYTTGRRGIAGTIFVHKIAGAKAEMGGSLQEVKNVAEKVIENVKSMGMALTSCTLPAVGKPSFILGDNEMEIGIGIHGEPGTHRDEIKTADEIVDELLNKIFDNLKLNSGDEVAVMVNGMGATPLMELNIANSRINDVIVNKGIKIVRTYIGNYMTSLDMAGFSITLLKLDDELKELLLYKSNTPALVQF
jgi:dihydroxyacetone kinase-like protein